MPDKDEAWFESLTDEEKNDIFLNGNNPSMYTTEGDDAVRAAIAAIKAKVETDLTIRNKAGLLKAASPILKAVAEEHNEIHDTEPDGWVARRLAEICDEMGWKYNTEYGLRDAFYWDI